jgi:hypothetical protein
MSYRLLPLLLLIVSGTSIVAITPERVRTVSGVSSEIVAWSHTLENKLMDDVRFKVAFNGWFEENVRDPKAANSVVVGESTLSPLQHAKEATVCAVLHLSGYPHIITFKLVHDTYLISL